MPWSSQGAGAQMPARPADPTGAPSTGTLQDGTVSLPGGFRLDKKIDVGDSLTALTITAGFIWFLVLRTREARANRQSRAESGAMRLVLKILREHGAPMSVGALYERFTSPDMKPGRVAYCGRDYTFKDRDDYDKLLYALDYENTIDFVDEDEVMFRVDGYAKRQHEEALERARALQQQAARTRLEPADRDAMFAGIRIALLDGEHGFAWDMRDAVVALIKADRLRALTLLREALNAEDSRIRTRTTALFNELAEKGVLDLAPEVADAHLAG